MDPRRIDEGVPLAGRGRVEGVVSFEPLWFARNFGLILPDPLRSEPMLPADISMVREKKLHQRFPDLPLGNPNPEPHPFFYPFDCGQMIALAFGAPRPRWVGSTVRSGTIEIPAHGQRLRRLRR